LYYKALKESKTSEYYESPILTKAGTERLIAWHTTRLTDETGKIAGSLSSGQDITKRKQMEEKIKELPRHIIHAQEDERQKIAREIHDDLGQSLIALKTYIKSGLCETYAKKPELMEFCESLNNQVDRNIEKARNIAYS